MALPLEHQNFSSLSDFTFKKYATNLFACNVGEEGMTYQQAHQKVNELQSMLYKLGLKQGDKIAICSENMPHWGLVYLAVTGMGSIIVPILPDFHSNEIHHIIKHSDVKALFASKKVMCQVR